MNEQIVNSSGSSASSHPPAPRRRFASRLGFAALFAAAAAASFAAERLDGKIEGVEWRCSLTVSPLRGDVKTTRSGNSWGNNGYNRNRNHNGSRYNSDYESETSTKSVTRNLKWQATVRVRGAERPAKIELKVDYVGHKGKDMDFFIMKSETMPVELDKGGKANVVLESPSATLTRTHTNSSSSSNGSYSSGFRSIKSTVSGQQVDGCIVRVYADGQLVRRWTSQSTFDKLAKTLK